MSHLVSRFGRQPMLGKLAAIFSDVKAPRAAEAKAGKLINWALAGLKDLRTSGRFAEPVRSLEVLEQMELANCPVMLFAKECCEFKDGAKVLKDELYAAWKNWCESQNRSPCLKEQFGRWLTNTYPAVRAARFRMPNGEREYAYAGLSLTEKARKLYLK
jgi:putative DNA primase/helicase